MKLNIIILSGLLCAAACKSTPAPPATDFRLTDIRIGAQRNAESYAGVSPKDTVELTFSAMVSTGSIAKNIILRQADAVILITINHDDNPVLRIPLAGLQAYTHYELTINSGLKSDAGAAIFTGKVFSITTGIDLSDKFERIPDEALLDLVQRQTFRYFWDFGHPASGMTRDRTTASNTVTTSGTGFGVMAILVAAERRFISRADALTRIQKIVTFLDQKCSKY
ncbi:MAG: Ig-like domain-containing protein, partial [Prevotellaceae bacterium]|nr:Ig-like domain-containing protein [Prevotellaceae bacterium]